MARAWLDIEDREGRRRRELDGRITLGGPHGALHVEGSGADGLHLWDDPPKLVFVGAGPPPRVNGAPVHECELATGDEIEWHGLRAVFGCEGGPAPLREVPLEPVADPRPTQGSPRSGMKEHVAWRRLKAGMLVELGAADRKVARRWQEAVKRGEFDAEACTREVLAADDGRVGDDDARLVERSGRLLRDLLMAPALRGMRGAGRRARETARGGLAFLLAQFVVIAVYSLILFVALFLVRVRWGTSVDGILDGLRNLF